MKERRLWFVRQNGEIIGPFIPAQITRNILLGRIHPNDELSVDEKYWQPVAMHRELYPDVMQEPVDEEKLNIARMQADERISEQRRERQNMAEERRRTRDRRENESDAVLLHRQHRKEVDETLKNRPERPKMPFLSLLLIVITVAGFAIVLRPDNGALKADCASPPAMGVNWSNCTLVNLSAEHQNLATAILTDAILNKSKLLGANLSDANMAYAEMIESDLSYANLENTRLIGANLQYADLRYASLRNADLSYADLSHAQIAGADISNIKLDNAIWLDGSICQKASIGGCRR